MLWPCKRRAAPAAAGLEHEYACTGGNMHRSSTQGGMRTVVLTPRDVAYPGAAKACSSDRCHEFVLGQCMVSACALSACGSTRSKRAGTRPTDHTAHLAGHRRLMCLESLDLTSGASQPAARKLRKYAYLSWIAAEWGRKRRAHCSRSGLAAALTSALWPAQQRLPCQRVKSCALR